METRKRNNNENNIISSSSSSSSSSQLSLGFNNNNHKSKQSNDSLSSMCEDYHPYEHKIEIRIKSNVQNSKHNGNKKDVTVSIPTSSTVNQLKDEIRSKCFNSECSGNNPGGRMSKVGRDRYLRLICSGRLLAPDSTKLSDFDCLKDGTVVHAVLAAPGVRYVF